MCSVFKYLFSYFCVGFKFLRFWKTKWDDVNFLFLDCYCSHLIVFLFLVQRIKGFAFLRVGIIPVEVEVGKNAS